MDFLAGTDVSLRILFEVSGQPKVPDSGSVTYTLRGDSGGVLLSDQPRSPAAGANYITISIDAANNDIVARYEYRTILTTFEVNGASYTVTNKYRLLPFLNHAATPDDARGFLGIGKDELADADVDLVRAYFDVETKVTQATLEAMLSGTPAQRAAGNDAVLFTAILAVIPSLKLRTAFSQTDGPIGFQRFRNTPDFNQLAAEAQARLSDALDVVLERETAVPTLILKATPTDPITAA